MAFLEDPAIEHDGVFVQPREITGYVWCTSPCVESPVLMALQFLHPLWIQMLFQQRNMRKMVPTYVKNPTASTMNWGIFDVDGY